MHILGRHIDALDFDDLSVCFEGFYGNRSMRYSNIERDALGILYGLEKFPYYYFAREVSITTDDKPLIAIFKKKDIATLSQRLQKILLRIHQYRLRMIYNCEADFFMADWLSRHNHSKNKDEEITGVQIGINVI